MNPSDFENSQVFEKLDQLNEIISDEKSKEKIDAENYNFILTSLEFIRDRLKITIPSILNDTDLSTVINELNNAISQVNNFLSSNNVGHLNSARTNLFSCITKARNFPVPISKGDYDFSKAIANFEDISSKKISSLSTQKEELSKQIIELSEKLKTKNQELDNLSSVIAQQKTEIQNLNSNFQTEFTNIKSTANQNFDQTINTFRSEIDNDKKTYREEIDKLKKDIDSDTKKLVGALEEKLDEAKKIVNVIGNVGATGNFQSIANKNKRAANIWRVVAIIFMTVLSGLLVYTIWEMSSGTFDWTKSIIRIIAAAALSYPATYAAQESSKHRRQENYNRRMELELASINPFIELLDEAKKKEIKERLVERYFGNNHSLDSVDKRGEVDIPVSAFEKIIKALEKIVSK